MYLPLSLFQPVVKVNENRCLNRGSQRRLCSFEHRVWTLSAGGSSDSTTTNRSVAADDPHRHRTISNVSCWECFIGSAVNTYTSTFTNLCIASIVAYGRHNCHNGCYMRPPITVQFPYEAGWYKFRGILFYYLLAEVIFHRSRHVKWQTPFRFWWTRSSLTIV